MLGRQPESCRHFRGIVSGRIADYNARDRFKRNGEGDIGSVAEVPSDPNDMWSRAGIDEYGINLVAENRQTT